MQKGKKTGKKKKNKNIKKVLFTATVDSHIIHFHIPYLKMFKEMGYEVHVATNGTYEIPYCDKKHVVPFERNPFKINNLKAIKKLKTIIDKEKFDIIHCHTPMGSVVTRIAAMNARKKGTRVIYTAHGFHFYKGAPIKNWILFYPIEKWLSRYTDTLITINQEDYELAKRKFHSKQIELVPGVGVDPEKFNFEMSEEEKDKLRNEIGINKDDFVMICIGELNDNKNQIMQIEAMEKLVKENKNIKLILAGEGNKREFLQKKLNKLSLNDNVKVLGYRKDIPKLLKISNLVLSTSKREGLPVNVIEALITDLPVIGTNCRGNKDILKNCNIVDINDVSQLVKLIWNYINKKNDTIIKIDISKYISENIQFKMKNIYIDKQDNNGPIRVLQIIRGMNVGGAETFIMNIYRNIDRSKVQFDFLVSRDGVFDDEIRKLGGIIYKIPYLTDVGQYKYVHNLRSFFVTHRQYKIIHSHIDQVSGIIIKTAKKCDVPVTISHSHSTSNSNNVIAKIYKKYLQNKINKYSTELCACSEDAAKWLFKRQYKRAKIINNGIQLDMYSYNELNRKNIRDILNIPQDCYVVGHVGRFTLAKNHSFLLDVFKEYYKYNKNSILLLIGDGELKDSIINKAKEMGINKQIIMTGNVTNVNEYYSAIDTFVFPSIYEGIPLTLIEAQMNGLPIIASSNVSINTKLSDSIRFYDLNESANNWASQIGKYKRKNEKQYFKEYDINYTSKQLIDIYLRLNGGIKC